MSWKPGLTTVYVVMAHGWESGHVLSVWVSRKAADAELARLTMNTQTDYDYEVTEHQLNF